MMDHRLISDALKRRDEQARQAHIALLIRPGLNGRYTFCDSKNNNKHHWKNNGRALIPRLQECLLPTFGAVPALTTTKNIPNEP